MKKIHRMTMPVLPIECFTKSEYARRIKKSPSWVQKLVEDGKLIAVPFHGTELVKEPSKA